MRRWQIDPYVQLLADAAHAVVPQWLVRCVVETAQRMRVPPSAALVADAEEMSRVTAPLVLAELDALLDTDAEAQRTNPLSILRAAVRHPNEVLARHHVPMPQRTEFEQRNFPADVYSLSPATWTDVDESLQEPGLIWGAWKAKTILDRRRGESGPREGAGDVAGGHPAG
ncbi:MAG: hypothetical protein JWL72_809 [Ilumatobacteraceae bacterium]|nr:hypothetical protein [Ilumatobacteraceae bacterium]MCU1387471.1 hypothetical protein [Ilumatobacteraceae bacterium]